MGGRGGGKSFQRCKLQTQAQTIGTAAQTPALQGLLPTRSRLQPHAAMRLTQSPALLATKRMAVQPDVRLAVSVGSACATAHGRQWMRNIMSTLLHAPGALLRWEPCRCLTSRVAVSLRMGLARL